MALLKGVRPVLHWGRDLFYRGQDGRVRSCPWTSAGVEAKESERKRKKAEASKRKQKQAKEELCLMPQKKEKAEERKRHRVLSKNESARWVGVLDVELSEITPRKPQYRKTQRERKERPQIWPNPPCIAHTPLALKLYPT